jgi:hypothetical protein
METQAGPGHAIAEEARVGLRGCNEVVDNEDEWLSLINWESVTGDDASTQCSSNAVPLPLTQQQCASFYTVQPCEIPGTSSLDHDSNTARTAPGGCLNQVPGQNSNCSPQIFTANHDSFTRGVEFSNGALSLEYELSSGVPTRSMLPYGTVFCDNKGKFGTELSTEHDIIDAAAPGGGTVQCSDNKLIPTSLGEQTSRPLPDP